MNGVANNNVLKFLKDYGFQILALSVVAYYFFIKLEYANVDELIVRIYAYLWILFVLVYVSFKWMTWKIALIVACLLFFSPFVLRIV
jgi:membrane-bound acyltransferase YfiQ involved in biofilm formation